MRYKELSSFGEKKLKDNGLDRKLSSFLMSHYLDLKENARVNNVCVEKPKEKKFTEAINKLIKGEAIQYIIGSVNFFGYTFKITKDVLIPRFETEELVNYTIEYITKNFKDKVNIIDIGTGSGIIGITLKKEIPNSDITVTDISSKALKIAKVNALTLEADIKIIRRDMLNNIKGKYDVIISNPPYIKEKDEVMLIVKNNEPKEALYGGVDGLKYYRKIICNAQNIIKKNFLIALEIDPSLTNQLIKLIEQHLTGCSYEIKKDMQGRERIILIFQKN